MHITATRFAIRDMRALLPDDYPDGGFDVIAHCSDGKMRHCDQFFDTRDEAEIALAYWEMMGVRDVYDGELEQWEVTTVSETEIQWQPAKEQP